MKKFWKVVSWVLGVLLFLLVVLAALTLRLMPEEKPVVISNAEMYNAMSAAGKLSSAMFRGTREPEKTFTVSLNPGETKALLASLRHLGDPYLENYATIRSIATEKDRVVCRVEVAVGSFLMTPVTVKAKIGIAQRRVNANFDAISVGCLPLPLGLIQQKVDEELEKFLASPEGKILPDFVSRVEFFPDGSLKIDATAQGFKLLRERLLEANR